MQTTMGYLDQLIRATDKSEAELMTLVFRVGLRQVRQARPAAATAGRSWAPCPIGAPFP